MSVNAELALAARQAKALAARLPEHLRPDLALEWSRLTDELEECRSEGSSVLAIVQWRAELVERLTGHQHLVSQPDQYQWEDDSS